MARDRGGKRGRKHGVAVSGTWLPVPRDFLRSRAGAELSPHAAKLLLDVFGMLGTNASGNGDISLTPKRMSIRGWAARSSLNAAAQELIDHGLLIKTRQGSRLDCSLFACTLWPLDCDIDKLDVRPGCYVTSAYMGADGSMGEPPTEEHPARWRKTREKLKRVAPLRYEVPDNVTQRYERNSKSVDN